MRAGKGWLGRALRRGVLLLLAIVASPQAWAGSARFVAGAGWGKWPGASAVWSTDTLLYFTDPGPLSANVTHAQADAMVAAAAAVWSTPTSSIAYAQGGTLAEDVSPANVSFDGQQFVFPDDMQSGNEANVPVAIVYDADGSLIDLLLGEGASEPDGCLGNGVLEDVDDIHHDDVTLRHALLILNGRCVGSAPEQMQQMQYQLARAMGRVLGMTWSQANDNVFTGQTVATANQMAYWPLMHPMDLLCGTYPYQCVTDPFTLRPDDLNTLGQLYPVYQGAVPAGKQGTSDDALWMEGYLFFPNGQGMGWVNLTTTRSNDGITETWQAVSGVTGNLYEQAMATPLNPDDGVPSPGSVNGAFEAYFVFRRVPLNGVSDVKFTAEAINTLYTGDFAIGTYVRTPAAPSGSMVTFTDYSQFSYGDRSLTAFVTAADAASRCDAGQDGTETAPAALDPSGWQTGLLCAWQHNSWWSVTVPSGHSWTLEVTATDETGAATLVKAQPVMGIWNSRDAAGTLPTVTSQAAPFNSLALGMTQIGMEAQATDQSYRVSVSDQYGAGRPDFTYVARVLYVAGVSPSVFGTSGGQIAVTGTGFRQGNQVLVNGVPAQVVSLSETQIVAVVPTMAASNSSVGEPVDVEVLDQETAGTATMTGAMTYTRLPDRLHVVGAPAELETGVAAALPLTVQVLTSDGLRGVAGAEVSFAVSSGAAQLGTCPMAGPCVLQADANGYVQIPLTGSSVGAVTLTAAEVGGTAQVVVTLVDVDPVRSAQVRTTDHYIAAGATGPWTVELGVMQDGVGAVGVPVTWAVDGGLGLQRAEALSGASGFAGSVVRSAGLGEAATATVTGCAWTSLCSTWTLHSVPALAWAVGATASQAQQVGVTGTFAPVTLLVTDGAGHELEGAPVMVYQRVLGWEGPCAGESRCAAAPVLKTVQAQLTSDAAGQVTFAPLEVAGVAQQVEIAASSGLYGFVTLTLVKAP